LIILDPSTNLNSDDEKAMKVDLRGFQAESSPYPLEDRGHHIDTATDLQEKYGRPQGNSMIFPLQAKLGNKVFGESYIAVVEPRLDYMVLRESGGGTFVAYPGDKLELPANAVLEVMDIRTNVPEPAELSVTMSGRTVRWHQTGSAGIDASKLTETDTPLDITRNGRSLGRIWVKQGKELRLSAGENQPHRPLFPVHYHQ
jgi:hypothetical protein